MVNKLLPTVQTRESEMKRAAAALMMSMYAVPCKVGDCKWVDFASC